MSAIRVNGRPSDVVPADDRGLLYGDGLFETVAFHHGRARLWALHMDRLMRGCAALDLPLPDSDRLLDDGRAVAEGRARCAVRITWTRGRGGRAYVPPDRPLPTSIVMQRPLPDDLDMQREAGIDLITVRTELPSGGPLGGLKHLNRLPQVLIGAQCRAAGVPEALVVDRDGCLVEALTGNLVIERDGRLIAPGPHPAAVDGVGLAWLRAAAGDALEQAGFRTDQLQPDDAIWVLNSVAGIRPVARLDGAARPTGRTLRAWQRRWAEDVEN
ncbi:aminodeoxychorismate lyase [Wenzhouxiangella sp. XN79A]|uniref:aminotransferase class IV n=1 Tax=Wenzhouxiangella sp. XN79A TaxID=2724193 RepID=UPI00144A6C87|nr:aminotransferase class IV [Wenzhouxiangella sp. XN79A]NKI34483.1 aminodeoxychorismate lyase [Wenzhouxiangella sp. XN79A]